ncbi:MAG: DUF763 domain-containing protein [Candidatus Aenigmatarchaeota archaeon]
MGTANLPLHGGKAPRWLFDRMEKLSKAISEVIIEEYSRKELIQRLSDPWWFQSFACVLGYDWHSSGTTTVTCGALKEALNEEEHGIKVVGGKGSTSRNAPDEILDSKMCNYSRLKGLERTSRMSAKVDSNCVQDDYGLYHHVLVFTEKGDWAVIQQGMNSKNSYARRYHWMSENFDSYVEEPHRGISTERRENEVLNLTSSLSDETRNISVDLVNDGPGHLERYLKPSSQSSIFNFVDSGSRTLDMPSHHPVKMDEFSQRTLKNLEKASERQPEDFEELVSMKGVGKKSLRALALIAELVHGSENDWKDPARFSYTHGGKDGYPRPVDKKQYDRSIEVLEEALEKAEVGKKEKLKSLRKLEKFKNPEKN